MKRILFTVFLTLIAMLNVTASENIIPFEELKFEEDVIQEKTTVAEAEKVKREEFRGENTEPGLFLMTAPILVKSNFKGILYIFNRKYNQIFSQVGFLIYQAQNDAHSS